MEFPFLSIITLSPIVAAVIILMLPKERGENARMLGLATMLIGLVLSIYVYVQYYQEMGNLGANWADRLLFVEEAAWIPTIGINYIMGVDGMSATLVLLDGDCGCRWRADFVEYF